MSDPQSLAAATATGARLTALRGLRDRLTRDLDECQSMRDVAALSQRLMDVLAQIDDLGGSVTEKKPETKLDEFLRRFAERQSSTK